MSDSKPQKDPSMDDILSSIRKIIQEDEGRPGAPTGGAPAGGPEPDSGGAMMGLGIPIGGPPRPGGASQPDDDVLLLTDLVDDPDVGHARTPPRPVDAAAPPTTSPPAAAAAAPVAAPAVAMAVPPVVSKPAAGPPPLAASMPAPSAAMAAPAHAAKPSPAPPAVSAAASPIAAAPPPATWTAPVIQPAIETQPMTTNPISSAMDRLARAVEDAKPPIAAPDAGPLMSSGRTLEDVVKEMLRPMLQEWMDKNLPQLVERMVEREVQRLTRS